eukprot:CAMPEP_0172883612 /NCGR_PEP_ID=MMETSP1075-20121228/123041_1 /TAXON_ID=2916 /ORGANISM="Ceratium fusus, Strain PA161109" /LENGTH=165 /DNA_ID=CAMNT_0013736537 /DNA_START=23 /DNA_END=516 /DNA_ORIENTATION=-
MDPQLEEYRRKQRERAAAAAAAGGSSARGTGRNIDEPSELSWLEKRHEVPGLGVEAAVWQLGLAAIIFASFWANIIQPHLYVWLLVAGLLGAAAFLHFKMSTPSEAQALRSMLDGALAAARDGLEARYRIGDVDVSGWQIVGPVLVASIFLGAWVLGWALLLAGG